MLSRGINFRSVRSVILSGYSEIVYRSVTLVLTFIVQTDHDGLI